MGTNNLISSILPYKVDLATKEILKLIYRSLKTRYEMDLHHYAVSILLTLELLQDRIEDN